MTWRFHPSSSFINVLVTFWCCRLMSSQLFLKLAGWSTHHIKALSSASAMIQKIHVNLLRFTHKKIILSLNFGCEYFKMDTESHVWFFKPILHFCAWNLCHATKYFQLKKKNWSRWFHIVSTLNHCLSPSWQAAYLICLDVLQRCNVAMLRCCITD